MLMWIGQRAVAVWLVLSALSLAALYACQALT